MGLKDEALRAVRRGWQMVFRIHGRRLNPAQNHFRPVEGRCFIRAEMPAIQRTERVAQPLQQVGLPAEAIRRYPQFSGGQRQRIWHFARALA